MPAAIAGGNGRKPKEIAQTDGTAGDGQYHPQFAAPRSRAIPGS